MLGVQTFGPLLPAAPVHCVSERLPGAPPCWPERDAWAILLTVPGLGPVTFTSLLAAFGSAGRVLEVAASRDGQAAFRDALHQLTGADGLRSRATPDQLAVRIAAHLGAGSTILSRVHSLGLRIVTLDDEAYPARLRAIEMPPPLLYVRGSAAALEAQRAIAVVGTRCPTDHGRRLAGWIASAVGRAGATVVSGLAVGVDGAAHAAAVADETPTVAVLGGGHARLFPRAHERLAEAIADAGGAVVSELPPDTIPSKGTFPRRNRVISGLSEATIVVEAGGRSGALITAGWALEQGRECYLVPGAIDAPQSAGCNAFLRAFSPQARIVTGIPELLDDLGLSGTAGGSPEHASATPIAVLASLAPAERLVAEAIVRGAATADSLAAVTSLPAATVLSVLTLLELRGLVASAYGRYRPTGALATWDSRATGAPVAVPVPGISSPGRAQPKADAS